MQPKILICRNCGKETIIANTHYMLCSTCNRERISVTPSGARKQVLRGLAEEAVKQTYKEMDNQQEHFCVGCGQTVMLSHSHLIRRSLNHNLIAAKDNIVYHCLERIIHDKYGNKGCHARWESEDIGQLMTLDSFYEHLAYIKMHETELYEQLLRKMNEYESGSNK